MIFCKIEDLLTESDVEQKFLWPLLTSPVPTGFGYAPSDIVTKHSLRRLVIDKGRSEKLYYPDYVVLLRGLPIFVIEAKRPDEDVDEALREARLYAGELNAIFPEGLNPCKRVIACNGRRLSSSPADVSEPDLSVCLADMSVAHVRFAELIDLASRPKGIKIADAFHRKNLDRSFRQAITLLGGRTVQNEQIGDNTFGARLAFDFRQIFNPITRNERVHIVRNAYVSSKRREAYAGQIDNVFRRAITSALPNATLVTETAEPDRIWRALRAGRRLENEIMLLIGAVGCGKSTFVDYLCEVKLPEEVAESTEWVRLNLNNAPENRDMLERWILEEVMSNLKANNRDIDFGDRATLDKVFSQELFDLKRGALSRLTPSSEGYETLIAANLVALQRDPIRHAKAVVRYLCRNRDKLLVVVFDNCDKRDRVLQLTTFDVAKWLQATIQCLVILPIRDVTYRVYGNVPPLDTCLKDLVFRIEPPPFSEVLRKRIELVLAQLMATSPDRIMSYRLPNGMTVQYPANELGLYVASIFHSLYRHDRLLRGLFEGLSARNIRRALEIFLEFCRSGHIGEQEFLKIRTANGRYSLPRELVTRVLFRRNRRFYDGDDSFVKNVFQCRPSDAAPDNFARMSILIWLEHHFKLHGPTGVEGFHPCRQILSDLAVFGHDADCIRDELRYLVAAGCVFTEHQRPEIESDNDLVALSPAGHVHVMLLNDPAYLAACAEDCWVSDHQLAQAVADRIGKYGQRVHYSAEIRVANARDFLAYLYKNVQRRLMKARSYLDVSYNRDPESVLAEAMVEADRRVKAIRNATGWRVSDARFQIGTECDGKIQAVKDFGIFVTLCDGPTGLVPASTIGGPEILAKYKAGERVRIRIKHIEPDAGKASLELLKVLTD